MAEPISPPERCGTSRFGLIDTFPARPMPARWALAGVEFNAFPCATPFPLDLEICPPSLPKSPPVRAVGELVTITPLGLEVAAFCGPIPFELNVEEVARRILDEGLDCAIEEHYWDRLAASTPTVLAPGPVSPRCALALLSEALGSVAGPGGGVIHAPLSVVSAWSNDQGLIQADGHLEDVFGDLIVAGRCYDVAPPGTTTRTVFAEAPGCPEVYLGTVKVLDERSHADATRTVNDRIARVEVAALVVSAPCEVFSVEVNICCEVCP
jgi:hypothetical protein